MGGSALPACTETVVDSERPCPGTEEAGRHRSLQGSFKALSPYRDPMAPIEAPYGQKQGKYSGWDWHWLKPL